jgi:serine/threonine-protein kinase
MASAQIDGRTDEYSLGCTLYFTLTGKLPFEGRNHAEVMVKHLKGRMPHPRRLRPDLSPDFTTILAHMVALNQRDRYASLQEVEQEIQALLAGKPLRRKMPPEGQCNFAFS